MLKPRRCRYLQTNPDASHFSNDKVLSPERFPSSPRPGHGYQLLEEVSDRFRKSRTGVTISGRLFQKSDGKSQFRTALAKVVPQLEKSAGI
jgi:hypothetical protein